MKTIIFGGTTEGREQAALALARGESVLVSVTSEYARQFLPEGAACHIGALDEAAMKAWIAAERPERIIDATHPFAVRATQTIRACADALHIPYVRIERAADRREDWRDAVMWAGNSEEAAALAALCAGNILLTTGSHTLSVYAKVIEPGKAVRPRPADASGTRSLRGGGHGAEPRHRDAGAVFAGFQRGALRSAPHPHDGVKGFRAAGGRGG